MKNILPFLFLYFTIFINAQDHLYTYYDVKYYGFDIEAGNTNTFINGNVEILFEALTNADTIGFDLVNSLLIDSIVVNHSASDYSRSGNKVYILGNFETSNLYSAKIYYHGTGSSVDFSGIYNAMAGNFRVTYTLSEPYGAINWFPCKHYLPDKADSVLIQVTVDDDLVAVSNGLLIATEIPEEGKLKYVWKSNYPIAYYLIAVTIGNYQEYSYMIEKDDFSVFFQNFIYDDPDYLAQEKGNIDSTVNIMHALNDLYGPYPFHEEKYGHVTAPFGGGMEHQTISTMLNFSYDLISHELAHQWFGDNVTCGTWNEIWLNEGFATYSEYLVHEYYNRTSYMQNWLYGEFNRSKRNTQQSIFVPNEDLDDVWRIFDGDLTYSKGAMILHMLRNTIQDDAIFFDIMQSYQLDFKDDVANVPDFINLVNEKTNNDYNYFFNQWYYGAGYPHYDISWSYTDDTLFVKSTQRNDFFDTYLSLRYFNNNGEYDHIRIKHDALEEETKVYLPEGVTMLLDDTSYDFLQEISTITNIDVISIDEKYRIFPNPSKGQFTIKTSDNSLKTAELSVYSNDGKKVYQQAVNFESNETSVLLNIEMDGIYFLEISTNDHIARTALVIDK
jgi:aminopeptidase N